MQLLACHVSKDRTCIPGTRTLPNHQQSMHNMYHSSEERKSYQLDRYRWPACLRCVNRWWFVVVCCEIQVLSIDKYKIIKAVAQSADKTRLAGRREEAGSDPCLFLSNFLLCVSPWEFTHSRPTVYLNYLFYLVVHEHHHHHNTHYGNHDPVPITFGDG